MIVDIEYACGFVTLATGIAHNEHDHHNRHFHALWNQLRGEMQALLMRGWTGEGFLSVIQPMGGLCIPETEDQRLARMAAAEQWGLAPGQVYQMMGRGRRMDGAGPWTASNMGMASASFVEARNVVTEGCGAGRLSQQESHQVADEASRSGRLTQAQLEEEANDVAIAQALQELDNVSQDEMSYDWFCGRCTLQNPSQFLCCEACGLERGEQW
ncbi:hypothetical protein CDD82_2465 [Ophiocordyceps australis]|uniref:WLM domain-containing protein n=1 Tax=Ophiocordyceps australis TaxID=1399860 RepID=A0A2C5ZMN7_9HYPO|nr:hypothetical protein CDD82_2465 [Ophiocordyceps australis]